MILQQLNYLHVIVAAIAYFFIGAIWFSALFSKPWAEGHGIVRSNDEESKARMKKEMPMFMLRTLVWCIICTISVAALMSISGISSPLSAVKLGLAVGVFPFAAISLNHMYTRKSFTLTLIDSGYHIVSLIIVAVILSVWH